MGAWTGDLTPITPPDSGGSQSCIEYLTVADVRAAFGDDVAGDSDVVIQRRIDQLAAALEDNLGHTFGRALLARSTANDTVAVTATALVIGGHSFDFATYPTLIDLEWAVNAAGHSFSLELLPYVRSDTPATLLGLHATTACGPAYENRVLLCITSMYQVVDGNAQTHLFLPLPLAAIVAVTEDTVALSASDYWAVPGSTWLVRKACACLGGCTHRRGRWSNAYVGNIAVTYTPQLWGRAPSGLQGVLLEAYSAKGGLMQFAAESFGDYSYRRPQAPVLGWQDILGGGVVRRYSVRFQP